MLLRRFWGFCLVLLAPLATASATTIPSVTYDRVALGNGNWGFNVFVSDSDNANTSFFATAIFTGPILQKEVLGTIPVDDNVTAASANGAGGYNMALDSYFYKPWTDNTVSVAGPPAVPGILDQPGLYQINAGTGPSSQYNSLQLAYIAATGNVDFVSTISRTLGPGQSMDFIVTGTLAVPEPGSIALLAVGFGLLLIAPPLVRRRSSRQPNL